GNACERAGGSVMKLMAIGLAGAVVIAVTVLAGGVVLVGADAVLQPAVPSATARAEIPAGVLAIYQQAAATCQGLPWSVLAAVGWVESRHGNGTVDPATGEVTRPIIGPPLDGHDGRALVADRATADGFEHAVGPMQILPATWKASAVVAPGRPAGVSPDPQNLADAAYTAARILCGDAGSIRDVRAAL